MTALDVAGLRRHTRKAAGITALSAYHDRPAAFARDLVEWPAGQQLATYQADALDELQEHRRASVRGPHGLGKTTLETLAILWFATTREDAGEDWKIPTTASAWHQLTHYLWPEVHKWAPRLRWDRIGRAQWAEPRELQERGLNLRHGAAFSASPADSAKIEGAHADQILYVFDEAKTIPADTFDAAEGAFAGAGADTDAEAFALACSTPGEPNGRFYEIQSRRPGTEDWTPVLVTLEMAVAARRVSMEWAEQRKRQWGEGSAVYQNRVLGNFASSDEDGVIPLAWVEAAQSRWAERHPDGWVEPGDSPDVVGVDCSGTGSDRTVLARRYGDVVAELERPRKAVAPDGGRTDFGDEEQATAARLEALLGRHRRARAVVDALGLGGGVIAMTRQTVDRGRVVAFVASGKTTRKDRNREFGFTNVRSAAWWMLREALDPDHGSEVALPPDDLLTGDLTAPHWRLMAGGKIQVESKDEIRKRLGRSTDSGDAVVQAFWDESGAAAVARPTGRIRRAPPTKRRSALAHGRRGAR